ncbi:MAG: DMT family transporter [Anaerolineales bacterium]|jgi:drug/metabolite transporter (DMT)-like permease
MSAHAGEWAALAVSVCWSGSALFFAFSSQRLGALVVNRGRLVIASALLVVTHLLVYRTLIPIHATPDQWIWLSLSGVAGLTIGDALLFQAYVEIGPRLAMLMVSTSPVVSTILAAIFLGQALILTEGIGILITIAGVAWVVLDRDRNSSSGHDPRKRLRGVLLGLGAATGQALGLVLSKKGLSGDFPALSAVVIRMLAATAVLWLFTLIQSETGSTLDRLALNPAALPALFGGSVVGPYLGVWLSLIAIQFAPVGIASTLMALPPILLIPIGWVLFHERIGWQAIAGTLVATAGVAMLFLVS